MSVLHIPSRANRQTSLGKLSLFLFYYAVCCIVHTAGYKCTHHTQTRIIWVYFLLRQKFSYFEPPPLKLKEPAIIHLLILSPQRPFGHIRKSLSRFVSISPSLSLLFFNFFPLLCPWIKIFCGFVVACWICCGFIVWVWRVIKRPILKRNLLY